MIHYAAIQSGEDGIAAKKSLRKEMAGASSHLVLASICNIVATPPSYHKTHL